MRISRKVKKTLCFFFIMVLFGVSAPITGLCATRKTIAIIRSRIIIPYNDAVSGFKEELKQVGYKIIPCYYDLEEVKGKEEELAEEIRDLEPDLVFALGTEAALFAKENINGLPIVFSMVFDPVESGIVKSLSGSRDNLTGVCLNIPVAVQFRKLKQLLPDIKRIGMLYDATKRIRLKDEATTAAKELGLELITKPVNSETDIDRRLHEVIKESDCLWAGIDTMVYNSRTAEHIILETLRHKLPFMAFSSHYVKTGALMALECDYHDIGRQSARIAIKVLKGEKAGSIPIELPRKTRLVINKRTAGIIGVTIPENFLEETDKVFGVE